MSSPSPNTSPSTFGTSGVAVEPDSGYYTAEGSLAGKSVVNDNPLSEKAANQPTEGKPRRPLVQVGKRSDLLEFDKIPDESVIERFNHICSQVEQPLLRHVCMGPLRRHQPMAIRLMVLGESEPQARPHIVVLCAQDQAKRARKYFDKDRIKALCMPQDCTLPRYDVVVIGRPPQPRASGVQVLAPASSPFWDRKHETFCGAPIVLRKSSGGARKATFGGIIKVVGAKGECQLLGLTVGHACADEQPSPTHDYFASPSSKHQDIPSGPFTFPRGFESDSDIDIDSDANSDTEAAGPLPDIRPSDLFVGFKSPSPYINNPSAFLDCRTVGKVLLDSFSARRAESSAARPKHDWALIDANVLRPNRVGPPEPRLDYPDRDLVMHRQPARNSRLPLPVAALCGSSGRRKGTLSPLPARVLLPPAEAYTNAHILHLEDGYQIVDGDSGSWVINRETCEVYGHVVASDPLGGAYMIPIQDVFDDIEASLACATVSIADMIDMAVSKLDVPRPFLEHYPLSALCSREWSKPEFNLHDFPEFSTGRRVCSKSVSTSARAPRFDEHHMFHVDSPDRHDPRQAWDEAELELLEDGPEQSDQPEPCLFDVELCGAFGDAELDADFSTGLDSGYGTMQPSVGNSPLQGQGLLGVRELYGGKWPMVSRSAPTRSLRPREGSRPAYLP